jgi:hypothetical protein
MCSSRCAVLLYTQLNVEFTFLHLGTLSCSISGCSHVVIVWCVGEWRRVGRDRVNI